MSLVTLADAPSGASFARRVAGGILWRSGGQIVAQMVAWTATFLVLRLLTPSDYGLFAMTQSVLVLFGMLTGAGFASALVRAEEVTPAQIRQTFGLLILLNAALGLMQLAAAPLIADYYHQLRVADLLRVQVLLYVANPFIALATALLSRQLEYRRQAIAHFASALAGAGTALGGAYAGLGLWTLVIAPIALFWTRALVLAIAVRWTILPSFRFRGTGSTIGFGLAMVTSQLFWFVQTQADIFIGGRLLGPYPLGLYTTALFLAQIFASKFVPPINEVAFAAYARLQGDPAALATAFAKSVRAILLVALPFSCGMALVARPLVLTMLGPRWAEAAPIVRMLACAMPFVTLQILFWPVTNALGKPRFAVYGAMAGAVIMPIAFAVGVRHGAVGLAAAWLAGFPLLTAFTAAISLPVIGLSLRRFAAAIAPVAAAAAGMVAALQLAALVLPPVAPALELGIMVAIGAVSYLALVLLLARDALSELLSLLPRRG